jgi:hypothetical protein
MYICNPSPISLRNEKGKSYAKNVLVQNEISLRLFKLHKYWNSEYDLNISGETYRADMQKSCHILVPHSKVERHHALNLVTSQFL